MADNHPKNLILVPWTKETFHRDTIQTLSNASRTALNLILSKQTLIMLAETPPSPAWMSQESLLCIRWRTPMPIAACQTLVVDLLNLIQIVWARRIRCHFPLYGRLDSGLLCFEDHEAILNPWKLAGRPRASATPRTTPADSFCESFAGDRNREIVPYSGSAQHDDSLGYRGRFVAGKDQAFRRKVLQQLPQQGTATRWTGSHPLHTRPRRFSRLPALEPRSWVRSQRGNASKR